MTVETSFTTAFASALRGGACHVVGMHDTPRALPTDRWTAPADAEDLSILDLCRGATLDIGCGPGRMAAALAARGHLVLGIDVVEEAVHQTTLRGAMALRRNVFGRLPAEGRWETALLADGNIGIGGNPVALLTRVAEVLAPGGRIVAEIAETGVPSRTGWAALECEGLRSRPFRWAVVGVDDVERIAGEAGLLVEVVRRLGTRWCVVLRKWRP